MNWSRYQMAIYEAFTDTADSLLIEAVAGSGKTRTLEELARIMGERMPGLRGVMVAFNKSIAQELQARIDAMARINPMSRVDKLRRTARAGMEPQAGDLFEKVLPNVQAMTLHSAGWAAWRRAGGLDWEPRLNRYKTSGIMREVLSYEENKRFGETTRRLVGMAKGCGLVPRTGNELDDFTPTPMGCIGLVEDIPEAWESLMDHYSLDPEECDIVCARKVLARGIELAREQCDFDDMLYMPVIAGVEFDRYDVVLVDEAQDVSAVQMAIIERMALRCPDTKQDASGVNGGQKNYQPRVIAVGDRHQAIYGFRGAGTDSMDVFQRRFQMRELPLSVTYRCPVAVVQHARQWVPQLEWREGAEDGVVMLEGTDWQGQSEIALGAPLEFIPPSEVRGRVVGGNIQLSEAYKDLPPGEYKIKLDAALGAPLIEYERDIDGEVIGYKDPVPHGGISKWRGIEDFQPGDAILCRLNRPVVAAAFALIRQRIPCRVLGRDIGAGLVALVRKAKSLQNATVAEFDQWLDDYEGKEIARLREKRKHTQAGMLGDRCDTLRVFMESLPEDAGVQRLISEVERMFVDNGGAAGMVTLATVHKAKGLEWARVFVLDAGELMPCPWARGGSAWEIEQERNCMYIAATRASRELRYITSGDLC